MGMLRDSFDKTQHVSSEAVGKIALAASGTGLTVQWLTDFGSLLVIGINLILGLGGIYLLWMKVKAARREDALRGRHE
jgi:hypothetical protein